MRLAKVTVANYRSILAAESFEVGDYTVLVGPNNEGKSNLMRAVVLALDTIHSWANLDEPADSVPYFRLRSNPRGPSMPSRALDQRSRTSHLYQWERDYPIGKQTSKPTAANASKVRLDFELDADDTETFRATVGSSTNGRLPVEILFGPSAVKLSVIKQGPGGKVLAAKSPRIAEAIASNLQMFSVPTSRTEANVMAVIQALVARQLASLRSDKAYQDAAAVLQNLKVKAVRELQSSLQESLQEYLQELKSVELVTGNVADLTLRVEDLLVDDGVLTSISEKGDGVKSLAVISLMQQATRDMSFSTNLIAAIDEPESHLHPEAIHTLKSKLLEIASEQQVIVSTHASVLVNRSTVASNIIVSGNRARPARSLTEIRNALGVRLADNLSHAELVLLVEGVSDEVALTALLRARSRSIARALGEGAIAVIAIRGLKRLHTELLSQRNAVCRAFVIADDDATGRSAIQGELDQNLIDDSDYFLLHRPGGDTELEDLYDPDFTAQWILEKYGVSIPVETLKSRGRKWSVRVTSALESRGKLLGDDALASLKEGLARSIAEFAKDPLPQVSEDLLAELIRQIERQLTGR